MGLLDGMRFSQGIIGQGQDMLALTEGRRKQSGLAALMGDYASGGAPDYRGIAENGGNPLAVRNDMQAQGDRGMEETAKYAQMFLALPPGQKPQAYAGLVARVNSLKMDHPPIPNEYDPQFDAGIAQFAQALSGAKGADAAPAQQRYLEFLAAQVPEAERQDVFRNAAGTNPRARSQLYEGEGGAFNVNLGNNRATPITTGGPMPAQAPQQPSSTFTLDDAALDTLRNVPPQERAAAMQAMMTGGTFAAVGGQAVPAPNQQPGAQLRPAPKTKEPSALEQRIAFAKSLDATPAQIKQMVLGGEEGGGINIKGEMGLRKEYGDLIKEPLIVRNSYNKVQSAAQNDSAAGDLSMIFAYMKMLDPNSVVRETEFANAQNAAGIPDRVRNVYNKAITGERLGPAQRADFVRQAELLAGQAQEQIDGYKQYYGGLATEYGFSPDRVAFDPFKPGGNAPAGAKPGGKQIKRTGMANGRKVVEYTDGTMAYAD